MKLFSLHQVSQFFKKFKFQKNYESSSENSLYLTKSRFMTGVHCDLALWYKFHDNNYDGAEPKKYPGHFPPSNLQMETIRKYANTLFPDGLQTHFHLNKSKASEHTKLLSKEKKTIFDATFFSGNLFAKTHFLIPQKDETWEILEIKNASTLKPEMILELGFIKRAATESGFKISKTSVFLINSQFLFKDEIDIQKYLIKHDLSSQVNEQENYIVNTLDKFFKMISSSIKPSRNENSCGTPKGCINSSNCWSDLGNGDIFELRDSKELPKKLFSSGIKFLKDISLDIELTEAQSIQIQCSKENNYYINKEKVLKFLDRISFPVYFLDFETINPSLPVYENSRPYQHIPFLYSLHTALIDIDNIMHHVYIEKTGKDPRRNILKNLSERIGNTGTILCYNDVFEKRCIRESAQVCPEFKEWYESISKNFLDISIPFRNLNFYHPLQKGSASLKSVLPALTDVNYSGLEIGSGYLANQEFLKFKLGHYSDIESKNLFEKLSEYCIQDSFAMVLILRRLKELSA